MLMTDKSYVNWAQMTDAALAETIGAFVKHHRVRQNLSQVETAEAAGISRSTLSLLERGEGVKLSTLIQVMRVLNVLHVMDAFEVREEVSPLAYAKLKKKSRQRASAKRSSGDNEDLGWYS